MCIDVSELEKPVFTTLCVCSCFLRWKNSILSNYIWYFVNNLWKWSFSPYNGVLFLSVLLKLFSTALSVSFFCDPSIQSHKSTMYSYIKCYNLKVTYSRKWVTDKHIGSFYCFCHTSKILTWPSKREQIENVSSAIPQLPLKRL